MTRERSLISLQLPRPSPIAPAPSLLRATGASTAHPPPGNRLTGPPHPRVSNPPHVLPGPGPRPGHWKGVRGLLVVRSKGLFSAASPGVDALVTGSPEARQRPHLRGSSPSGHSLASGLWGRPSKVRHPLPRTCCPTGSGLGKLGLLFDSVPLRLEFPRSHFSQKTQGKIVIQITDKISEHTLPGARAAPTQGPASVQAQPWPSPRSWTPQYPPGWETSPAGLPPTGPSAGHRAMRLPRPSTAARSPAQQARDTGPFLREGQARAPRPGPVLPASARTPVLLCFIFTTCSFLSSPPPIDPPITRRPSAVTRDLTRPFFLNDTSCQVRNRPSCVQSEEAGSGLGLLSGSPPRGLRLPPSCWHLCSMTSAQGHRCWGQLPNPPQGETQACSQLCLHRCTHTHTCTCTHTYTYTHLDMYIQTHLCLHTYTYTYTCTHTPP